jgi:hypothetical protein
MLVTLDQGSRNKLWQEFHKLDRKTGRPKGKAEDSPKVSTESNQSKLGLIRARDHKEGEKSILPCYR